MGKARVGFFVHAAMLLLVTVGGCFAALPAFAAGPTALGDGAGACDALLRQDFSGTPDAPTQVMDAQYVAATVTTPAHCLVEGYVAPTIGFGLKLPIAGWNSKFLMMGCGGSCGSYRAALVLCDDALRRGYACAGSDQGHGPNMTVTPKNSRALDRLWAFNNLQAKVDHAGRAISATAIATKEIARRFYSAEAKYTYFLGCSDGGRSAMIMAQHYPNQFDGIIAIDPVMRWSRDLLESEYNYQAITRADGSAIFNHQDLTVLHQAVLADCDKLDGLVDGVIGDPRLCHFDPGTLTCKPGQTSGCLSEEQVAAARKIYAGLRTSTGKQIFYGSMPGSELSPGYGFSDEPNSKYSEYYRYMLFSPDRPNWTREQIDPDNDYKRMGVARTLFDAENPDLREFKARGGKLIIAEGWDDSGLPQPRSNIDYYEQVERLMGGEQQAQAFARLFMMPGAAHCGGGAGASQVDYMSYLENWVEKGQAPDVMIAYHLEKGANLGILGAPKPTDPITFSRPIYPYPLQFKYKGKGDPNDFRSFGPVRPPPVPDVVLN